MSVQRWEISLRVQQLNYLTIATVLVSLVKITCYFHMVR